MEEQLENGQIENNQKNGKTMKLVIIILVIAVLVVGVFSIISYKKAKNNEDKTQEVSQQTTGTETGKVAGVYDEAYFDDNASIMFFYSELCGWCNKEKKVLEELVKDGYKVKPMNVKDNPDYWTKYNIDGTPAFIASNGQRAVGFMEKEELKKFLDENN